MRKILILIMSIACLLLAGCDSDIQWFKEKDSGKLVGVEDTKMKQEVYYTKQGSRFYPTLNPKAGAAQTKAMGGTDPTRVIPLCNNSNLVPSLYYGEGIAYTAEKNLVSEVIIERYKDMGFSLGCYHGTFDENGYYTVDRAMQCLEDSSLGKFLDKKNGDTIRIDKINDQKVDVNMVDLESGVIVGLEEGKSYVVQIYVGTKFYTEELIADTQMLKSFEFYDGDSANIDFSPNGYLYYNMPTNRKSGYYWINGSGLFKYYDFKKGDQPEDADMNAPFYENERDAIIANSKQFTVSVPNRVKDMEIKVNYSLNEQSQSVKGYVYAPDGTQYEMKIADTNDSISLNLTEASAGNWTVALIPKSANYRNPEVNSTKAEEQPTLKEKIFTYDTDTENIIFSANVKSADKDDVHGHVTSPKGVIYDMVYELNDMTKTGTISCEVPFLESGEWNVKVYYHPTTTELEEITANKNIETETEVIVVE